MLLKKYASEYKYSEDQIAGKENLINKFLEKIATDLIPLSQEQLNEKLKCQICFKDNPESLRSCPNCKKTMHLPCVGNWSSQMKLNNPYVFRCPFCFFLLRVPHEFIDRDKVKW